MTLCTFFNIKPNLGGLSRGSFLGPGGGVELASV